MLWGGGARENSPVAIEKEQRRAYSSRVRVKPSTSARECFAHARRANQVGAPSACGAALTGRGLGTLAARTAEAAPTPARTTPAHCRSTTGGPPAPGPATLVVVEGVGEERADEPRINDGRDKSAGADDASRGSAETQFPSKCPPPQRGQRREGTGGTLSPARHWRGAG